MRIITTLFGIVLLITSTSYGAVTLKGNLVIQETDYGARFLGEVINDTETAVTYVRVTVNAKDSTGAVIDSPYGFIDGYRDPDTGLNTFLPEGFYAPFMFYGTVDAGDIDSYEVTVEYQPSSFSYPDTSEVAIRGEMTATGDIAGTTFRGEISNNLSEHIYFVRILVATKDTEGNLTELNAVNVNGDDYIDDGSVYTDTLIQPGETAPFRLLTVIEESGIGSYYSIITYRTGQEGRYDYYGDADVEIAGEVEPFDYFGYAGYRGEIANNTGSDLYFVKITFTTRNDADAVLDVDYTYVEGSEYELSPGYTTPTRIAPGETAPFEVISLSTSADAASYEYVITYRYDGETTAVDEHEPSPFTLGQNYPNPFNPDTVISFSLPVAASVQLDIFNQEGQRIETLIHTNLSSGNHQVTWDGSPYASGVYIYSLTANKQTVSRKMLLVK